MRVPYENRFHELEPLLARVEKPTRYIDHEWGALYKPEAEHRCVLIYPDVYEVGLPIKENTKKGYKMAYPGDSINLAFAQKNTRRGRVGRKIAHTLTASSDQGTLEPLKRIRRLTPRECLRLQGWADERIDIVLPLQSDAQLYKQAGNGVTVTVVEAIGKRLAAAHREVTAID